MTYPWFSSDTRLDPVFSGSYDEGFNKSWFSQNHDNSLCAYSDKYDSASSQNFHPNYDCISAVNVPYSSFSADRYPYSALVPNRILSDPLIYGGNTERYTMTPPQYGSSSAYDCYNVQRRNLTLPDSSYPASCNPHLYQQSSDFLCHNDIPTPASLPHVKRHQYPAYPCQLRETADRGTDYSSALSYHYDMWASMLNTAMSVPRLSGEDFRLSLQDRSSTQWPTISRYPNPSLDQPCVLGKSFEAVTNIDTFPKLSTVDYSTEDYVCHSKSTAVGHHRSTDICTSLGTNGTLRECAVNEYEGSRLVDCKSLSSCVISSAAETRGHDVVMTSTTAQDSMCHITPEMSQPREQPGLFTPPIITSSSPTISDWYSAGIEELSCDRMSVDWLLSPKQTSLVTSDASVVCTDRLEAFVDSDDKQVDVSDVNMDTVSGHTVAVNNSPASSSMPLPAENGEITRVISPVNTEQVFLPEVSADYRHVENSLAPVPEVMETTESVTVIRKSVDASSNANEDVIVLSQSPSSFTPAVLDPVNLRNDDAIEPNSTTQQSVCAVNNTGNELHSYLCPVVPKSHPARLPHVGSYSVGAAQHQSLSSVPVTGYSFSKLSNCDDRVVSHNCSVQRTCCQRQLSNDVTSGIPANSHVTSCSHGQQSSADSNTCSCLNPMLHLQPMSFACNSHQGQGNCAQSELTRLLHVTPSSLDLSKPNACNLMAKSNDHFNDMEKNWHQCCQRPMPSSSQTLRHHGVVQCNARDCVMSASAASRSMNSVFVPRISHNSTAMRTNFKQHHFSNYKPVLPVCRQGSLPLQLHDYHGKASGTYSVRAASILLQRLKQRKLSDFVSSHAAQQQLQPRLRPHSVAWTPSSGDPDVIDLTGSDMYEESAEETCELVFARTRRYTPNLLRLRCIRQNLLRQYNLLSGASSNAKSRPTRTAFSVDRSLPFYQCFVQKLLRNFRFTSCGVPVKVYPEFREILPVFSSQGQSSVYEELVAKRRPVVVLTKLDRSLLDEFGSIKLQTVKSGAHVSDGSPRIGHGNSVPDALSRPSDVSQKLQSLESEDNCVLQDEVDADSEKPAADGWQCDKQNSLCRPLSVVLERLDRTKIHHICKDLRNRSRSCHQDDKQMAQLDTDLSVTQLSWTVSQIPRANRVPIIIIRATQPSDQDASRTTLVTKTSECRTRYPRRCVLKYSRPRNCAAAGVQLYHHLSQDSSNIDTYWKRAKKNRTLKKQMRWQERHSASFVSAFLRTKDVRNGHILRPRNILMPLLRPGSHISSKHGQKQSKSLVNTVENGKRVHSKLADQWNKSESLTSSFDHNMCSTVPNSVSKNDLSTDVLSNDSDSNTIELSPYSSLDDSQDIHSDVDAISDCNTLDVSLHSFTDTVNSVNRSVCSTSLNSSLICALPDDFLSYEQLPADQKEYSLPQGDSATDKALPRYSTPCDSGFSQDLPDDCLSSDSDTVVLSRQSSMDDLTINYRSPVFAAFEFDEPTLDQPATLDGDFKADIDGRKFDVMTLDSDQDLKRPSTPDCFSFQFSGSQVETCTLSESLRRGMVLCNAVDNGGLQLTPAQIADTVYNGPQTLSNRLPEQLVDKDQTKKGRVAASVSDEIALQHCSIIHKKE